MDGAVLRSERWRFTIGIITACITALTLLSSIKQEKPPPEIPKYLLRKEVEAASVYEDNKTGSTDSPNNDVVDNISEEWLKFEATAYTAECAGCIGITKTGIDVRNTIYYENRRIIAVDPKVIALGSTVEIRLSDGTVFEATAQDVGGAIKGRRIDLLMEDKESAMQFGRQSVEIRMIKEGD